MARSDYVGRVKSTLYGQGLGEKPSMRRLALDAGVLVGGSPLVNFDLFTGEGAKVNAGDVLCFISENDAAKAYVFYVISVSTDTVTAYNGYHGAPAIANGSTDMDGGLLEHGPLRTEFEIHKAIDVVFETLLYPEVGGFSEATVTPSPTYGQVELNSAVQEIHSAWQLVAGEKIHIPFNVERKVHTSVSTSTVLGTFDHCDNSTIYYTYLKKLSVGDEDTDESGEALVQLVAAGAAALALDMSAVDGTLERSHKDSQNRRDSDAASRLLRLFYTLKAQWSADDAQDFTEIMVERYL